MRKQDRILNKSILQMSDSYTHQSSQHTTARESQSNFQSANLIMKGKNGKGDLWLGGLGFAQNYNQLKQNKINTIVSMYELDLPSQHKFIHFLYPIDDTQDQQIAQPLKQSIEFIQKHINHNNILVHCLWGVSRSPMIVIGYLMFKHELSYEQALTFVKQKRSSISINPSFQKQLKAFNNNY